MIVLRRLAAALLVPAALAAAAPAAVVQNGQPVMGTVLQVTVAAPTQAQAKQLAEAAFAEARRWDDVLTTWRPQGELARFNATGRTAGRKPAAEAANAVSAEECVPPETIPAETAVSPELYSALEHMLALSKATGGAFDPAVGPLVGLWRTHKQLGPLKPPGERFRIATALRLQAGKAGLAAGAALDAGGIGKGIALDAIARKLRAAGATSFFLDFGGSSQLAFGAPAAAKGSPGWPVAVAALASGATHGLVALQDTSLSTSRALPAGDEAGPIVDPRSGNLAPAPRLATVLGPSAIVTDAWSTALVVLGREGVEKARAAGLEVLYEDAAGVVMSDGFRQRLGNL